MTRIWLPFPDMARLVPVWLSNCVGKVKIYEFLRFFSVNASIFHASTFVVDLI